MSRVLVPQAVPRVVVVFLLSLLVRPVLLPAAPTTPARPATAHAAVSDAQLEATIRMKLAKSKIGKDGFKFHVQRGVVTWEGTTTVGQHKGAATRMARTSGAIQVVNNIKVNGAGKGPNGTLRKAYVQP
jgi:hypothetical protein